MASSGVKKEASSVPADVDGNTWKKSLMRSCHHGFLIHQLYFYVEMTGPDAAALLTILALLCFSLLLQLLFRYLIMRLLFCFSSFVTSRQLRWEHATLFLACLKVFLSYSMHRSSPHFDPLDSSSVDWFHLQKLIPSGPLYHDCISPKLCFLLLLPLQNRRSGSRVQMFLLSLSSSRETDTTSSTSFSLFVLLRPESLSLRPPNISDASALLKRWRLTHQRDQNKQKKKFCVGYYYEIYNF